MDERRGKGMDGRKSRRGAGRARWAVTLPLVIALLLTACTRNEPTPTPPGGSVPAAGTPAATGSPLGGAAIDKVDNAFLQLLTIYQTQGADAARTYAADQGLVTKQDEVRMTLVLDSEDPTIVDGTALAVGRLGGRVTASFGNQIELVVPVQTLLDYPKTRNRASFFADLADFQHVINVRRTPLAQPAGPLPGASGSGGTMRAAAKSEGVALTGADTWQAAGITGKGVKVGVIDGAFNNYKQILGGANVTTKSTRSDGLVEEKTATAESVHGAATAEIVREMAPDAELFLVAVDTPGSFISAIKYLTDTVGVPVITTSLGFDGGYPIDGTGALARAIDDAKAKGVFFVISAGNEASGKIGSDAGEGHFTATFADTDQDGWNDFAGAKTKNGLQINVKAGRRLRLILNWEDWKNTKVNYDLYLYDSKGQEVGRSDENQAKGRTQPIEIVGGTLKTSGTYTIKIKKVNASDPNLPFHLYFSGAQAELVSPEMSLSTPADANGAVTVAAISAKTGKLEDYSSRGPTSDGRKKPDIGAPDDVTSDAYATVGEQAFFGTSAAAPHVGGAAALYKQAFPDSTPDTMLRYFTEKAKKPQGVAENTVGAGLLFMDAVPQGARTTAVPPRATATPAAGTTVPTPATSGTVAFSDNFASSSTGLPTAGYQSGEYRIKGTAGGFSYVTYPKSVRDAAVETYEVSARKVSGAEDAMLGLVTRWLDRDNYLMFVVFNDGSYTTAVKFQGSIQEIGTPGRSTAYTAGAANTLTVKIQKTRFSFAINGQVVSQLDIPDIWLDGSFGMLGGGGEKAPAELGFKDYTVRFG